MLKLPREMCVIRQTRLSLIVAEAAGHDPLIATGLLLTHFGQIAKRSATERGVVWELRALYEGIHSLFCGDDACSSSSFGREIELAIVAIKPFAVG